MDDYSAILAAFADVFGWTADQTGRLNRQQIALLYDAIEERRRKEK